MKRSIMVSLFVIFIALAGCQSNAEIVPKANMFDIEVEAPEKVKAKEAFAVYGSLVNRSSRSWEIQHGADMFTYDVYDRNGKLVLQDSELSMVNDIGFMKKLEPKESYRYDSGQHVYPKPNEFALKAGTYTIVSKAKFTVKHGGKDYEIVIGSSAVEIEVR